MDIVVDVIGVLSYYGTNYRCALGRNGVSHTKRESDGTTPAGRFLLREVLYRSDRIQHPETRLLTTRLMPDDGWCDEPGDTHYNQKIKLPYPARHERLWRTDHLYDLVVNIGYNDTPVESGRGSAIFMHCATPDYSPTDGCIALASEDILELLERVPKGVYICIQT